MNAGGYSSLSRHDNRPAVLFVGDSASFSDMYVRLIQSEFPDVAFLNVMNMMEAKGIAQTDAQNLQVIVLACRSGHQALTALQALVQTIPTLQPVLAYQTKSEAGSALTVIDDKAFVERLSFLPLRARMDCTVTILRLVLSGERYVSGEVLDTLMAWKSENMSDQDDGWTLTAREQQVLAQLAKGASNKMIARELDLAESTVKLHIHHIISKLGVKNRTEAAVAYVAELAKKMQVAPS